MNPSFITEYQTGKREEKTEEELEVLQTKLEEEANQ